MRVTKPLSVVAIAVFALVVGYSFLKQDGETLGSQPAGRAAPDFSIALFDGGNFNLKDLRGKPVVVNFWASWCGPCREEAPVLEKMWNQYREKGVVFVGVDIWDTESDARAFMKEFGVSYPNGPDPSGKIAIQYGVTGVPETFFVARDGKVTRKFLGAINERQLAAFIEEILR